MRYLRLLLLFSIGNYPLFGQASLIKTTNKQQINNLIKLAEVPKKKLLPAYKVNLFFKKKAEDYVLVETRHGLDFFYGATVKNQVRSIAYVLKKDLKGNEKYYLEEGINHFKNGEVEKTLENLRVAIALGSKDQRAYLGMMQFDYHNDQRKYQTYLNYVKKEGPKNLPAYWKRVYYHMQFWNYYKMKNYSTALELAKKVLTVSEEDNTCYNYSNVAYMYQHIGKQSDYLASIPYFENALLIDSTRKNVHHDLGFSYFKTEQYEKAVTAFEKGEQIKPQENFDYTLSDLSKYFMGVSNLQLGNIERGLHQLNLFLENQPKHHYTDDAYYFQGLAYIYLEEDAKIREAMIKSAKLGHRKAIDFAAENLPNTIWYSNKKRREADEKLAVLFLPLVGYMIEDSINQLFEANPAPTEQEIKARFESPRNLSKW